MSSNVWPPRIDKQPSLGAPRAARIVSPGGSAEAKPMEWRELGKPPLRTGGKPSEPSPDAAAQMDALKNQIEQRVREAHAAGVREAEASAKTRAAAEVQAALDKMAQSIADLAKMRGQLRKQAEGDTVKLSLAIARRVLRREVAMDSDAMRGIVIAAMEKLQSQEICRVRASASQAGSIAAILKQAAPHVNIEVILDGTLAPGGIVFETNQGNLDASVDSQLQEIERGLADHLRKQS